MKYTSQICRCHITRDPLNTTENTIWIQSDFAEAEKGPEKCTVQ